MTKEQEESLEKLKRQILIGECEKNIGISVFISDLKNVLSMLKEKDKQIDLMAEFIEDELTVDEFCTKEGCYADNYIDGHCEKCLNCIKQYFENKAKE
mgnify:CR=1 FL=1